MKYNMLSVMTAMTLLAGATPAMADITGYSTTHSYLHAGPGSDFPVVAHVSPGASLDIKGCTRDLQWCDVAWNGNRGWIGQQFLSDLFNAQHSMPTVVFEKKQYWDSHYQTYPFYAETNDATHAPLGDTPAEVHVYRYSDVDE